MAFILRPECNFLNGCFWYLVPLETVDIEVKIKIMRGIHTFRRDKMQFLEHKTPSLPLPHLEDEDVSRIRGYAWSQTQDPATTKHQGVSPK